jgi:hypothetical protein
MIARVLKRTLISWLVLFAIIFAVIAVCARPLLALAYFTVQHRVAIALRQRWLANPRNAAAVAADLRQFAREQRWDHPDKTNTAANFYYHDDSRFSDAIKRLEPSWIQISDDRIDVGCGEITHEGVFSFGVSVWRDPKAEGYGTKKIGEGIWYYQQEDEYP